jgi:hypothetical protein
MTWNNAFATRLDPEVESRESTLRSRSRRGSLSVNTDSPWQECGVDPHDADPILTVRNLSTGYGKKQVLFNVSLDVMPGWL